MIESMPQQYLGPFSFQRNLSRKRFFRSGVDRDDRGWTPLHISARKGDLKMVKQLLDEGMDVNVAAWGPKSKGVTPLHLAAQGGHLEVMDELLDRGADIDARTKGACGWTPLHTASKERKKDAVKFLIENGAFLPDDINDSRFNPPLHYCPGLEWAYEEMKRFEEKIHHQARALTALKAKRSLYSLDVAVVLSGLAFASVIFCLLNVILNNKPICLVCP